MSHSKAINNTRLTQSSEWYDGKTQLSPSNWAEGLKQIIFQWIVWENLENMINSIQCTKIHGAGHSSTLPYERIEEVSALNHKLAKIF